jgi:hypothetical protein
MKFNGYAFLITKIKKRNESTHRTLALVSAKHRVSTPVQQNVKQMTTKKMKATI